MNNSFAGILVAMILLMLIILVASVSAVHRNEEFDAQFGALPGEVSAPTLQEVVNTRISKQAERAHLAQERYLRMIRNDDASPDGALERFREEANRLGYLCNVAGYFPNDITVPEVCG